MQPTSPIVAVIAGSASGHEDHSAPPRLSGRSAFSEETFARRCGDEMDAYFPNIHDRHRGPPTIAVTRRSYLAAPGWPHKGVLTWLWRPAINLGAGINIALSVALRRSVLRKGSNACP